MKDISKQLFRWFVVPGVIIEVILFMLLPGVTLLDYPVGGPKGIACNVVMIELLVQILFYFLFAVSYSIILPIRYFKERRFIQSSLSFLLLSNFVICTLVVQFILAFIECYRWDSIEMLNMSAILPLFFLCIVVMSMSLFWTIRIYRNVGLKFFSKATLKSMVPTFIYFGVLLSLFVISVVLL